MAARADAETLHFAGDLRRLGSQGRDQLAFLGVNGVDPAFLGVVAAQAESRSEILSGRAEVSDLGTLLFESPALDRQPTDPAEDLARIHRLKSRLEVSVGSNRR